MNNLKIIDKQYYETYKNKNLSNLIKIYNIKFTTEPVTSFTYLDKLAYQYYGDGRLWWIICIFNNITDPITGLEKKSELLIPLNPGEWIDRL